ncbi:hypothetical protein PanWU01x14_230810, partial [Parasponia andersonii]
MVTHALSLLPIGEDAEKLAPSDEPLPAHYKSHHCLDLDCAVKTRSLQEFKGPPPL